MSGCAQRIAGLTAWQSGVFCRLVKGFFRNRRGVSKKLADHRTRRELPEISASRCSIKPPQNGPGNALLEPGENLSTRNDAERPIGFRYSHVAGHSGNQGRGVLASGESTKGRNRVDNVPGCSIRRKGFG